MVQQEAGTTLAQGNGQVVEEMLGAVGGSPGWEAAANTSVSVETMADRQRLQACEGGHS